MSVSLSLAAISSDTWILIAIAIKFHHRSGISIMDRNL